MQKLWWGNLKGREYIIKTHVKILRERFGEERKLHALSELYRKLLVCTGDGEKRPLCYKLSIRTVYK